MIFCGLPIWSIAQLDDAVDITIVDRIPLKANTALFIDSLHEQNELQILSKKIQIAVAPRVQTIPSLHYFKLNNPLLFQEPQQWEYQATINEKPTSNWRTLPKEAFNLGLMKAAFNLIDTVLNFGDRLLIQLRKVDSKRNMQQLNVYCKAVQPQLLYYRILARTDTLDNSFIANNVQAYQKLAASFDSIKQSIISIEAGQQLQCLFKLNFLNKDSCLEYRLKTVAQKDANWKTTGHLLSLPHLQSNAQYQLELRYKGSEDTIAYTILVAPFWYETLTALGLFTAVVLLGLFGLYRYRKYRIHQARKLLLQQLNELQVKLNPHFVYNALGTIEGLAYQQDTAKLNYYIQAFSGILRSSLLDSQNLLIPLRQDVDLLEKYILLEQLHHRFQYDIHIDSKIPVDAIEFPPMFLQPLIENAIKHGVVGLYEKGKIQIDYLLEGQHLLVRIFDNGVGVSNKQGTGLGKKITLERAERLSKFLKHVSIQCNIVHAQNGTRVNLLFKNWLSV